MEYVSALGALLIVMLFGGGFVIVAYLAFDDMRRRGTSFDTAGLTASIKNSVQWVVTLPTNTLIMIGAAAVAFIFVYLAADSGYFKSAPAPQAAVTESSAAAVEAPAAAPVAALSSATAAPAAAATAATASGITRTVTSASCGSDGCPVSCEPDEILTSAYCISGGSARLSDQLKVKDGTVTARCGSSANSIQVACARK